MSIYIGSLAFGGLTLLASLFGGHGDGGGHDAGGGHEAGGGHGHDGHQGGGPHGVAAGFMPFLSIRFWTFALTFFGLCGLVVQGFHLAAAATVPFLASGLGVATGYTASRVFQALAREAVGKLPPASSHVGREGRLLLPVGPGQRGKIRLSIGGADTDLVAESDSGDVLPAAATVLVVGIRENVAVVERSPAPPALEAKKERT